MKKDRDLRMNRYRVMYKTPLSNQIKTNIWATSRQEAFNAIDSLDIDTDIQAVILLNSRAEELKETKKMKNVKIISYQRNGVMGNGFYVATCNEFGKDFVVTFETGVPEGMEPDDSFADRHINVSSCRAICLTNLAEKWRGDDFARELQKYIERELFHYGIQDIYDLLGKQKAKAA